MSYQITYQRPKAGRMSRGPWVVSKDDREITRFDSQEAAQEWVEAAAGAVQRDINLAPASAPETKPAPAARPARDRQATRVARQVGLPAPRATGRCHYCGLPLTLGECEECI